MIKVLKQKQSKLSNVNQSISKIKNLFKDKERTDEKILKPRR